MDLVLDVLDLADKLGSVFSALFGLLGVLLTAWGLWEPAKRQGRRARSRLRTRRLGLRRRRAGPDETTLRAGTSTRGGLYIPTRSESVPDSRHLPTGHGGYGSPHQPRFGPVVWWPRRLAVVAAGLVLLALATVTWLL